MRKFLIQLLAFLCLFFGTWYFLSRIHFTERINFNKISKSNEQKLGNKIIEFLKRSNDSVVSDSVINSINTIRNRICISNNIDTTEVKIHLFYNGDINAFALPGNNMVIYSGIIDFCNNPEELASVMAHEIAHIKYRHMVKKLTKEIGISVLATLSGGQSGSEILREVVRIISSTSFDREMEREADTSAVRFLARANIDPENFANLLFRLSRKNDVPENFEWISTHPASKNRTAEILKLKEVMKFKTIPLMDSLTWNMLKRKVK
jgi:beta-barrel assembly-enhancing protease